MAGQVREDLARYGLDVSVGSVKQEKTALFAGKLHVLFFRKYSKGRDYYDLLFYLRKKCAFNL
ncbi:MAG: hypothetical protein A2487_04850 [Candidatus Raymondbacteria bacterium RifOxyC12_full_50_8]|uniref:Uncharacterized protein n=1 Tax=Candidatus Raymondbacteria bacterium RIFOXYD12_FULL_49_13 TaxID=1817890 RepID=A0A1F7FBN1_UNCRA|nr:MAG: hypothetical protein A2350_20280 [Candidatus Raymondbacteria bacterium RifOxyB12_full_50_8]OGJ92347.1 MAG: hypothetical protein A2248_10350 [Candidatus Raymondbacteria bacterium RIFOXYA2_FULL_49_16]OGJ99328.1 MAG: hypothetical protein A2453_13410 [Candidatus Raymondbacteria bacterium RIFOXYC2_FULL_50_21]OGK00416.1 MAG: hypothetical protein A2487_04850 [Candidatus Raymondbacteria bacterium RifOxyC12_full_50_8]OGK04074.1 MAG: hypothetical protein A2519_07640 [Candidatus Raymondbacteria ba